jgi:hypothetical protein
MPRDQILALILDCITQGKATEAEILMEAQAQGITPDDINYCMDACIQFGWIYALEPSSARDRASYGITSAGRKSRAVMDDPGHEPVPPPPVTEYRAGRSSLVEIQNGCRIDYFYGGAQ